MKRREFIGRAALVPAALATPAIARAQTGVRWRMPTSFPSSLATIQGGAVRLAEKVAELTDGGFRIQAYAAGELVPPLGVLEAVQTGTTEAGYSPGFFYVGKKPALAFDAGVPFGMTPRQHFAWFHHGGGGELMAEVFAPFNIVTIPAGNTGAQMGGWFRKPIDSVADLQGLRIRAAGYLGYIFADLGAVPQQIAIGDLYPAMERGTLDAVEFTSPVDDETLGLNKVAQYYYAPGILELGASLGLMVNKDALAALPPAYAAALRTACAWSYSDMLARYDSLNVAALRRLIASGTELRAWSPEIMAAMRGSAEKLFSEQAEADPDFGRIHTHWRAFLDDQLRWMSVNDVAAENVLIRG
ncbi:TRAP transporter substrate-binding protein [Oceanicella sp. SM1341]|uniref:TRAP transporter substrate-binding protein n=1 Tax=Oceanicella sp. SM1341 TaxID=1548889 RepID=UPI000E517B83|nr:TRAP transporter substrate-binding protein DctP [Oceanicella sp. SM1341]